jgi:hypothetical protein
MGDWDRPPAGLAAAQIIEDWLPRAFSASTRRPPPDSPSVRATLSGPGGGDWHLQADDESLHVETRAPGRRSDEDEPHIWLRQSAADFQAIFHLDPDLPELLPNGAGVVELLCLEGNTLDLVHQLDGRIRIEIEGRRRRRWTLDVAFGQAGRRAGQPRSTVRIDSDTCEKLASGELAPLQALLGGKLVLQGDRTLVMQVLMAFAGKIGRR